MNTPIGGRTRISSRLVALGAAVLLATTGLSVGTDPAAASGLDDCTGGTAPALLAGSTDTFAIATAANLIYLSASQDVDVTGVTGISGKWREQDFVQTGPIDLSGCNFTPIGGLGGSFVGNYDGGGWTITGLTIDRPTVDRVGMFGQVGTGSTLTITDVRLLGVSVTGKVGVGALVGSGVGLTIANSSATGEVTGDQYVGGLVGDVFGADIERSFFAGDVDGNDAGGLVGYGEEVLIVDSYATGTVTGNAGVGGLIGVGFDVSVTYSYANGTVTQRPGGAPTDLGGLVGINDGGFSIFASFASVGPLVGSVGSPPAVITDSAVLAPNQFTSFATFDGRDWDIVDGWEEFDPSSEGPVWGICAGLNDGVPFLLWQFAEDEVPVDCGGTFVEGDDEDTPGTSTAPSGPALACTPSSIAVGGTVTCTVSSAPAMFDFVWRAGAGAPFAEGVVTTGADGTGSFTFVVPRAALGETVTVELVAWSAPVPIGVAGGPVPGSVPSGGGPVPFGMLGVALLGAAALAVRRVGAGA